MFSNDNGIKRNNIKKQIENILKIEKKKTFFIILSFIFAIIITIIVLVNIMWNSSGAITDDMDTNGNSTNEESLSNWSSYENVDFQHPLKQLSMVNANAGWAITEQNEILYSKDAGTTWSIVSEISSSDKVSDYFVNGFFLDENTAYISYFSDDKQNIAVEITKDRGASWKRTLIPYTGLGGPNKIFIDFIDPLNGYLLYCSDPGAGLMTKILFFTNDGGDTFNKLNDLSGLKRYPTGMAFSSDKQGFISSTNSGDEDKYLYMTKDAGITWESIKLPDHIDRTNHYYVDGYPPVFFGRNRQEGVLMLKSVLEHTVFIIYSTTDGGMNWTSGSLLDFDYIRNYSFYDLKSGYLIDKNGKVFYIEN